jgi:hypothetical protein
MKVSLPLPNFKKIIFFILLLAFNVYAKDQLVTEDYYVEKLFMYNATQKDNRKIVDQKYVGWTYFIVSRDNSELTLNARFNDEEGFIGNIKINCKNQDCSFISNHSTLFKVRVVSKNEIIILKSKWTDFKKDFIFKHDSNSTK